MVCLQCRSAKQRTKIVRPRLTLRKKILQTLKNPDVSESSLHMLKSYREKLNATNFIKNEWRESVFSYIPAFDGYTIRISTNRKSGNKFSTRADLCIFQIKESSQTITYLCGDLFTFTKEKITTDQHILEHHSHLINNHAGDIFDKAVAARAKTKPCAHDRALFLKRAKNLKTIRIKKLTALTPIKQ